MESNQNYNENDSGERYRLDHSQNDLMNDRNADSQSIQIYKASLTCHLIKHLYTVTFCCKLHIINK